MADFDANLPERREQFATIERNHLRPGIFQATNLKQSSGRIVIKCDLPNGGRMEIVEAFPLTVFDAVLLAVIVCKSAEKKRPLPPEPLEEKERKLRSDLELKGDVEKEDGIVYATTARQLIRDMGLEWGSGIRKELRDSIKRLFTTAIFLERKKGNRTRTDMFHIISHTVVEDDGENPKMVFALNPVLAQVLFRPGFFARISIDTLSRLVRNEKLMYIQLCNAIDPGKSRTFSAQELSGMLYGQRYEDNKQTTRQQRWRAKACAKSVVDKIPGWKLCDDGGGRVIIERPCDESIGPTPLSTTPA